MQSTSGKLEVIKAVSERIPMNSLGLPEGFYRPDMLPDSMSSTSDANGSDGGDHDLVNDSQSVDSLSSPSILPPVDAGTTGEPHQELVVIPEDQGPPVPQELKALDRRTLAVAFVPLSYDEGFPTLPDGSPFWEQLEFEPLNAFNAFRAYLAQGRTGARQLFSLDDFLNKQRARDEEQASSKDEDDPLCNPNLYDPTEVHLDTVNPNLAVVEVLTEFFHLYYWSLRAKSYDLFRAVVARRTREERALSIESTHYIRAEALLNRVYMAMNDEDFIDQLTPKAIIDLYKELTRVMRISSGLPGSGPLEGQAPQQTSVELILREASRGFIADDGKGAEAEYSRHVRDTILSDPKMAHAAQELIIRMNTRTPGNTDEPLSVQPVTSRGALRGGAADDSS